MSFKWLAQKWPWLVSLLVVASVLIVSCAPTSAVPRGWSGGVIGDGTLFLGSMEGKVVAVNTSTHLRQWQDVAFEAPKTSGGFGCAPAPGVVAIYGTPAVSGGLVYAAGYNGKVYAVDASTGRRIWVFPLEGSLEPIIGGAVVDATKVYIGSSDGNLYALDAKIGGDPLWKFKTADKIWGTPGADGGNIYFGSFDKNFYSVNGADGKENWRFPAGGAISSTPIVHDKAVYFSAFDRYLYALDTANGRLRWKFLAENWFWATPVIYNNVIYAGSLDGKVYALKTDNGDKVAEFDLESPILSMAPAAIDGSIIVATEAGELYSLDTSTNQRRRLADLKEKIYAPLSVSSEVVYIHTEKDTIYAVDGRSGMTLWSLALKSK